MLTPIRLLADPDALPPSPPSDLAWLRTCGAAGIEKEGKNCERRRGPEKWDVDYRDNNRINCYDAGTAPCKTACPAHIAVQGYLKMAGQGR